MEMGVVSASATSLVAGNRFASGGGEKPAHQRFRFLPVSPSPPASPSSSLLVSSTRSAAFGRTSSISQLRCPQTRSFLRIIALLTSSSLREGIEASSDISYQSRGRRLARSERVVLSSSGGSVQYLIRLRRRH